MQTVLISHYGAEKTQGQGLLTSKKKTKGTDLTKNTTTEQEKDTQEHVVDLNFDDESSEETTFDDLVSSEAYNDQEDFDEEDASIIDLEGNDDQYQLKIGMEEPDANKLPAKSKTRLPSLSHAKDALYLYMREISKFPLLQPEEEHELALRVRDENDADAAFRLVSSHLRLVVRIAMDFQRRWMQNVLDLIQEGNVGLLRAVNKFDPDKGIKFSYYASFWIKAYILKFIMDNWRMVKIGTTQTQRKLFYNLNRERQKLIAQGYDPDTDVLSKKLGVSQEQIEEMNQRMSNTDMSLNTKLDNEGDSSTHMDFLPALGPGIEDSLASAELVAIVRSKIKAIHPLLNEKEKYILENRLLSDEPATLREIGERYNITRERVRQLEARLLEKIKKHFSLDIQDFSSSWIE